MFVIKRDGSKEEFNRAKLNHAIIGAFESVSGFDAERIKSVATDLSESISVRDGFTVEEIQNRVETALMQTATSRRRRVTSCTASSMPRRVSSRSASTT
ncbi:MAG: hypothetical protein K2J96_02770 [Bacteroidaceae bacterium]|nr:hypothetical protein [Bacteroidaceae bacterium]